MPGAAAAQRATQQFTDYSHAVTLVLPKRHQCAKQPIALRHYHHARVGRRVTKLVYQGARLDLLPFVERDPHLALGHTAGGEIQNERLPPFEWNANAARVGSETAIRTTPGCHNRAREHVDKMQ